MSKRENKVGAGTSTRTFAASSLLAGGEPMVWLTSTGMVVALLMVAGLVGLVLKQGIVTFWPRPLVELSTVNTGRVMGEVVRTETYEPGPEVLEGLPSATATVARQLMDDNKGQVRRRLVRTGNFELTGEHFRWVSDFEVPPQGENHPSWGLILERQSWGRFYGVPVAFVTDGQVVATDPTTIWQMYDRHHDAARHGRGQQDDQTPVWALRLLTATEQTQDVLLQDIVRGYPANQLTLGTKLGLYLDRWREFLIDEPREANSEGGVFPAIFGTVIMTLGMTLLVVPFGVMAALYLREYAKAGWAISLVRIAINNLAGVPSIVFGVFGLGFFSYMVGGSIDSLFFADKLPNPTFGTGGIMWASLTLALLTLPVVIVATEEALAAVPSSMREGSYACGATKWQTIRRVVLPRSLPGIMTGAILAMARGAGEVAPLMLVGAVKLAPELPLDLTFPFLHPERSFMHLGFHIYDLGFQSQNSEAAKPMVFTTTLLLMSLILALNAAAIALRTRLSRKFTGSHF